MLFAIIILISKIQILIKIIMSLKINYIDPFIHNENIPPSNTPPASPTKAGNTNGSPLKRNLEDPFSKPSPQKRVRTLEEKIFLQPRGSSCTPSPTTSPKKGVQRSLFTQQGSLEALSRDSNASCNLIEILKNVEGFESLSKKKGGGLKASFHELASQFIMIPHDHLFAGSDLVIFPDSYVGLLPLNGIKRLEFDEISSLYKNIVDGKTKFLIHDENKNKVEFKNKFDEVIKTILTRNLGRQLIRKVLDHSHFEKIYIKMGASWELTLDRKGIVPLPSCVIYADFNASDNTIQRLNNSENRRCLDTNFINFLHELIHVWHDMEDWKKVGLLSNLPVPANIHMHNKEEERTITLTEEIVFDPSSDLEDLKPFLGPFKERKLVFSENSFRAVFGLPLRCDHRSALPRPVPMQLESQEAKNYFGSILWCGIVDEVKEMIDLGIFRHITIGSALSVAAQGGCLPLVSYFIENHVQESDLCAKTSLGNVLECAIHGGNPKVFFLLLDYAKKKGKLNELLVPTLLHLSIKELREHSLPIVKELLKLSLDPFMRNIEGKTALDISYEYDVLSVFKLFYEMLPIRFPTLLEATKQRILENSLALFSDEVAEFLVQEGTCVNDYSVLSIIWQSIEVKDSFTIKNPRKIFNLLVKLKVDFNTPLTIDGESLLHLVARKRKEDWIDILLEYPQIDLLRKDAHGRMAFDFDFGPLFGFS